MGAVKIVALIPVLMMFAIGDNGQETDVNPAYDQKGLFESTDFYAQIASYSGRAVTIPSCASSRELSFEQIPHYENSSFVERWDPYYQTHYTSRVRFEDGISGKVFKGGVSKKYFIGDGDGGKYYYVNLNAAIRALYLYKKYRCISRMYKSGMF